MDRAEAIIIGADRYEEILNAWEEAEDIAASDASLAEDGPSIPWEDVKRDLGWID